MGDLYFLIIGILFLLVGVSILVSFLLSRIKCSHEVEATISKYIEKPIILRGTTIRQVIPVLTYTVNGKSYTQRSDILTTKIERYPIGKQERIRIDPNDPKTFRYGSNIGFVFSGLGCALIGVILIVCYFL